MRLRKMALLELRNDEFGTIRSVGSGRAERMRLASLGFTPGAQIIMTQNYGRGPVIVSVRGARVALGRGEAAEIIVERATA